MTIGDQKSLAFRLGVFKRCIKVLVEIFAKCPLARSVLVSICPASLMDETPMLMLLCFVSTLDNKND